MKHARVLIVDSDRRLRAQLDTRLADTGVLSDAVSNGSEALELLRDRSYGLILLDLELVNDEAYRILDSVRIVPLDERPMILGTSARDAEPTVDPELVQIVIRKPLRLADVADMIRSCVDSPRDAVTARDQRADRPFEFLAGDEEIVGIVR